MQKITLIGNIGTELEPRQAGDNSVMTFRVAVNESWYDNGGDRRTHTEWFECVAWNGRAEAISKYSRKGAKIYIEGRQRTDKYVDKDGVEQYRRKVIVDKFEFCDSREA